MKAESQFRRVFIFASLGLLLAACNFPVASARPVATKTPFMPQSGSAPDSQEGRQSPDEAQAGLTSWWISPDLPQLAKEQIFVPEDALLVDARKDAELTVVINEGELLGYWVYALVAPFPTVTDEVSLRDLRDVWEGDGDSALMMTTETEAALTAMWGEASTGAVDLEPSSGLLDAAWEQNAWAIVPFQVLEPKWKVLAVEGQSPVWKEFEPADYALAIPIGLAGDQDFVQEAVEGGGLALGNRDPGKLTTVVTTGVTALVRATAFEMNRSGITYPAEEVGEMMSAADITHISNEVPFWSECPLPDPVQRGLKFCSDPDYIELLKAVGTDVVELTGDHFNDQGQEAMLFTLDLYDEHGFPYYGGGHNLKEARATLTFEHNGNRIAFIGCNGKTGYATASETLAGAAQCDYEWLALEVSRLHAEGYLVIATFQHNEVYTFVPQPTMIRDFAVPAEAGASIVSGSQAHQAHGMAFTDEDTLVMYGLGNMFFDQKGVVDNGDLALIGRHVFYDGRYISTELFTIQFVDYAKPRYMTPEERAVFLETLFDASLWND